MGLRSLKHTFQGRLNGGTKIEAVGFSGQGCETAIRKMAEAMGGDTEDVQHEPEYYETEKEREYE